jgi:neopullulanase
MEHDAPAWVADAVFYQVFPDRFAASARVAKPGRLEPWAHPPTIHGFKGGDLLGVVEHLDDLEELGVNALYLNPIFASAANHRYHTYDYLHVDPLLGGDGAFRELLDEAHRRGMRIVIDGVFNHSGRGFWPFHHLLETGLASPYRDWFHVDHARLEAGRRIDAYPESHQPGAVDPAWAADHRAGARSLGELGYRAWWDLPALPKLNLDNPELRDYLLDVAAHWIGFGADGWRLDVPEEVEPRFWHAFRQRVKAENPGAYLVGEIWHEAPDWVVPGGPFDGVMNYPLAWATIGFAAGSRLDRAVAAEQGDMRARLHPLDGAAFLAAVLAIVAAYGPVSATRQLTLLGTHDTPRVRTVCGGDVRSVQLAMLLLLALPGAPCIYYGDEIGLMGHADPDCRAAFPWAAAAEPSELRDSIRSAIALRAAEPALRSATVTPLAAADHACAFARGSGSDEVWVAVNAGDAGAQLTLPAPVDAEPALAIGPPPELRGKGVRIPPRSGAVLRPTG